MANGGCGRQTVPPFVLWLLSGRLFVPPEGTKDGTLLNLRTMHHGCAGGTAPQSGRLSVSNRPTEGSGEGPAPSNTDGRALYCVTAAPAVIRRLGRKKKNPIRAEKDVVRGDEGLLQRCGAASRSGNVNIFKAERSCHRAADAALRTHSHWQNFFFFYYPFISPPHL